MDDKQARALLGENVRVPRQIEPDATTIRVDRETHAKIEARADAEGLPISKFVRKWAEETLWITKTIISENKPSGVKSG